MSHDRRYVAILFVIVLLYVTAFMWTAEKHSCERANGTRTAQGRAYNAARYFLRDETGKLAVLREQLYPAGLLDCGGLLPDAK